MREMGAPHPLPGEARVEEQQHCAHRAVEPPAARNQRTVHRIMADDEQPDREPALQRRNGQRKRQAAPGQRETEHRV
jgi:hypothetical protein